MNNMTKELSAKSHYIISLLAFCGFSTMLSAQGEDSTLVREMLIEKEYTPVVKDADKIVRMPAVEAPVTNKTRIIHSNPDFKMSPESKLDNLQSGNIGTDYEFNKERGYLNLGYGNYNNILFDKGFKFVDTDANKFGLIMNMHSVSGKLKSNQTGEKSRMRDLNSLINLFYNHKAEKIIFSSDIKLGWDDFSYYGGVPGYDDAISRTGVIVRSSEDEIAPVRYLGQRLDRYGADFRIDSRNTEKWEYNAFLSVLRLGFRRPDFNENTVHLGGKLSRMVSEDWRLTGDIDLRYLFYGGEKFRKEDYKTYEIKNSGLSSFKAYFDYDNKDKVAFKGGLVLDVSNGLAPHLTVAPYVDFKWNVSDIFGLYSSVKGGMKQYSYNDVTKDIRFFNGYQTRNSYTPFDFNLGFKVSPVNGLQFDIAGNIDYTINQRYYKSVLIADLQKNNLNPDNNEVTSSYYYNSISAFTANTGIFSIKGAVKYNYGTMFDIALSMKGNAYSVKNDVTPSYMPKFELGANITYKPTSKLIFNVNYDLKSRHDAVVVYPRINTGNLNFDEDLNVVDVIATKNIKLDNISMLDFNATYIFTNHFNVFGKLDNILNNKTDVWYGMPSMGIHFMAGINLKF